MEPTANLHPALRLRISVAGPPLPRRDNVLCTITEFDKILDQVFPSFFIYSKCIFWVQPSKTTAVRPSSRKVIPCRCKGPHSYYWGKVHPCTGTEALYRPYGPQGGRGIPLPFNDHGTKCGWGVSVTPRPLFTPGKDPVPIVQEAGWAPGLVWAGAENLAPTGIRSPDRPARSQSLYRLRHPAHKVTNKQLYIKFGYRGKHFIDCSDFQRWVQEQRTAKFSVHKFKRTG